MSFSLDRRNSGKYLMYCGIIFTLLIFFGQVFIGISMPSGSIENQLQNLAGQSTNYQFAYFLTSLFPIVLVMMMILLGIFVETKKETKLSGLLGIFLLAPYVLLISVGYTLQYTILPRLLHDGSQSAFNLAKAIYILDSKSLVYFLVLLGNVFFAISSFNIGYKFLFEKGIAKALGCVFWITGGLIIMGFAGFVLRIAFLESFYLIGGVMCYPVGILVTLLGAKIIKSQSGK